MTVGVVLATLWQGSLPVFVNLHSSSRGDTRKQLQAPIRKQHVAVELDPAKLFMKFSPFCWTGHTARFLGEPFPWSSLQRTAILPGRIRAAREAG